MAGLQDDLSFVLQVADFSSGCQCRGFTGIASQQPCQVVLTDLGLGGDAQRQVRILEAELTANLLTIQAGVKKVVPRCSGNIVSPLMCHAQKIEECLKVLVIVGDGMNKIPGITTPEGNFWAKWLAGNPNSTVLPVFPVGTDIGNILPPELRKLKASQWTSNIREVVHDVFYVVGLDRDRRIFISYIQKETSLLAEQLFEELTKASFDVFLDRFKIAPGINFQEKLTEELADKSMVLVLESPAINDSKWTDYEISFAKEYKLGILALKLPLTKKNQVVPGVDNARRLELAPGELDSRFKLNTIGLSKTIDRIRRTHRTAYLTRRYELMVQIRSELQRNGIPNDIEASGLLVATSKDVKYGLWMTPRPARTVDYFHANSTDSTSQLNYRGLIAPRQHLYGEEREVSDWLSKTADLGFYDPSRVAELVNVIRRGRGL